MWTKIQIKYGGAELSGKLRKTFILFQRIFCKLLVFTAPLVMKVMKVRQSKRLWILSRVYSLFSICVIVENKIEICNENKEIKLR